LRLVVALSHAAEEATGVGSLSGAPKETTRLLLVVLSTEQATSSVVLLVVLSAEVSEQATGSGSSVGSTATEKTT
jgi:hypothetical protein